MLVSFGVAVLSAPALAEEGLDNCAELFPGGKVKNAPASDGADGGDPATGNVQICERTRDTPFFALEYNPGRYAPIWVSYRIGDTFGRNGCASMTRDEMGCYFRQDDVAACIKKKKGRDPFHPEALLMELGIDRLGIADFSGTGHDRGHMAPNNSFSWHACGAYKTFTMANMVAQMGGLNRRLWADLEAQVLYWGIKEGPILVVTGPIWNPFPSREFDDIRNGDVNEDAFVQARKVLTKRGNRPLTKKIPQPTGFFKVVYRPPQGNRPERAVAFLVPHTNEQNLSIWSFVAPISLIEKTAGLKFSISARLKKYSDPIYWQTPDRVMPARWTPRRGCKEKRPPLGWNADSSTEERIAFCSAADPLRH